MLIKCELVDQQKVEHDPEINQSRYYDCLNSDKPVCSTCLGQRKRCPCTHDLVSNLLLLVHHLVQIFPKMDQEYSSHGKLEEQKFTIIITMTSACEIMKRPFSLAAGFSWTSGLLASNQGWRKDSALERKSQTRMRSGVS